MKIRYANAKIAWPLIFILKTIFYPLPPQLNRSTLQHPKV
jgi:hypothetical protein